jgi:hypothetical protein
MKYSSKQKVAARIICIILVLTMVISCISVVASAESNPLDKNLNELSSRQVNALIDELVYGIATHDTSVLQNNSGMYATDCYTYLYDYIENNDINSYDISDLTIDYTYPSGSSTGDTVIMANAKVWYDNQTYNMLYLFEFHVDSHGDIYGYNVWLY